MKLDGGRPSCCGLPSHCSPIIPMGFVFEVCLNPGFRSPFLKDDLSAFGSSMTSMTFLHHLGVVS